METVGVELLKENLTDLLKRVENGERISIVSQGYEVALSIPGERRVDWRLGEIGTFSLFQKMKSFTDACFELWSVILLKNL